MQVLGSDSLLSRKQSSFKCKVDTLLLLPGLSALSAGLGVCCPIYIFRLMERCTRGLGVSTFCGPSVYESLRSDERTTKCDFLPTSGHRQSRQTLGARSQSESLKVQLRFSCSAEERSERSRFHPISSRLSFPCLAEAARGLEVLLPRLKN